MSFHKAGTQLPDITVSHSSVQLKLFLLEAWIGPWQSKIWRLPEFLDNWQVKVAVLSALLGQDNYHECKKPGREANHSTNLKDKEILRRHLRNGPNL